MRAVCYLYARTMVNRVRKSLRRPVTYLYLAIFLFYITALPFSLKMILTQANLDSPEGMAAVLTVFAFWMIPGNLIAYAKRRGVVYRNSDVHFLFPSPVAPKVVLLYAHIRTLAVQLLLNFCVVLYGRMMFHADIWRLAVYFLFSVVLENLLEGSIMLLLYGSEKMGKDHRDLVVKASYGLVLILVLMGIYAYLQKGLSWGAFSDFLHSDMVQMVPIVGWYIAVVHLLLTGATAVNTAAAVCYFLLLVLVMTAAWRMKCTGAYYEDAMKFAEDYEEVLESRRQGVTQRRLGKKQKFGKAGVRWRGHGARALFYRQLLEYKKSRFFIFDGGTVAAVLAGVGVAWLYLREGGFEFLKELEPFVIPIVASYVIFVFTALNGKWAKELASPYTYLIPDTPFRKLMNATAMQHLQSLAGGILITLPGAVVMKMPLYQAALCVVFYVVFSANKLYALAVVEAAAGSGTGRIAKQLLQMLVQSLAAMAAVMGAMAGYSLGGTVPAYVMMDVCLALFTSIFIVLATLNFYKMETV